MTKLHIIEGGVVRYENGTVQFEHWRVDGDRENPEYIQNPGLAIIDAVIELLQETRKMQHSCYIEMGTRHD